MENPATLRVSPVAVASVMVALSALLVAIGSVAGTTQVLATIIGIGAGFALYHAAFGFTSGWRKFLFEGRGHGLRMQFVLIGVTSAISFPLIAYGELIGIPVSGAIAPIGLGVVVGAFLFGGGMMYAGGCGSGTLFTVGGGSVRMVITLGAFIVGSVIGTLHLPWWQSFTQLPRIGLVAEFGAAGAYIALIAFLGAVWLYSIRRERRLHGDLDKGRETQSILSGPWSPFLGALAIAVVSIATIMLLGRPWGITSAFALWGAKGATLIGVDVASWPYWQSRTGWLQSNVLRDATSIMNFGIMGGAMLAAVLARKFQPQFRLTWAEGGTAIFGGLLMGYGARLAYGCNIGAYLGGLVSGSLHGLVWMIAAFAGSALALKIRFGKGWA